MKLITFADINNIVAPGLLVEAAAGEPAIIDLSTQGFPDAISFLSAGPAEQRLAALAPPMIPLEKARLVAPIPRPPRIFAVGLNYREHAAESKREVRDVPTVFIKLSSCVIGPGAAIQLPHGSEQIDYEAELAVVICKPGYRIAAGQAMEHVFGYTILNDVTARDVQNATSQWTLGKSFPTFAPCGPVIVTKDEILDPHALSIRLSIDGEALQDGNTRDLIFPIPRIIEYISSIVPLEAGDLISTGTPAGVGNGRTPKRWLKAGEEVLIEIEGIGELRNPVTG